LFLEQVRLRADAADYELMMARKPVWFNVLFSGFVVPRVNWILPLDNEAFPSYFIRKVSIGNVYGTFFIHFFGMLMGEEFFESFCARINGVFHNIGGNLRGVFG